MGFFDFIFNKNAEPKKSKCSPGYIKQRKAELIEQERQKEEDRNKKHITKTILIKSRNKIPQIGDIIGICGDQCWSGGVVREVYKNCVFYSPTIYIFTNVDCVHELDLPYPRLLITSIDTCYISEVREQLKSYKSVPEYELRRARFLVDIKRYPWDVFFKLPEYEQKAIKKLEDECYP